MMKICFVVPRAYYLFNPYMDGLSDKIGGSQKQAYLLSIEIAKNTNFEVHFCVADFGQPSYEIISNVKISKSFSFSENRIVGLSKLFNTLKRINADIYILRAADVGVAITTLFIKFILRKKVVYMLASDAETNFTELRKMLNLITALTMPLTYRFADKITAQTNQQFELFYKKRGRKPDSIIKNIITIHTEKHNYSEKDIILWVGRLIKHKNPELFIELASKFPKEKFIMIAPGVMESSAFELQIKKLVQKINNLKLIDFVNPKEIIEIYKKAKIYVMTSESEGFSNTMAEAMAMGCAILSFKVDNDHILGENKMGLCSEGNKNKLESDLGNLIDNETLRAQFAENAMAYVQKHHTSESIVEKFISIL